MISRWQRNSAPHLVGDPPTAVVLRVGLSGPNPRRFAAAVSLATTERLRILLLILPPRLRVSGASLASGAGLIVPEFEDTATNWLIRHSLAALPDEIPVTVLVAARGSRQALRRYRRLTEFRHPLRVPRRGWFVPRLGESG